MVHYSDRDQSNETTNEVSLIITMAIPRLFEKTLNIIDEIHIGAAGENVNNYNFESAKKPLASILHLYEANNIEGGEVDKCPIIILIGFVKSLFLRHIVKVSQQVLTGA